MGKTTNQEREGGSTVTDSYNLNTSNARHDVRDGSTGKHLGTSTTKAGAEEIGQAAKGNVKSSKSSWW